MKKYAASNAATGCWWNGTAFSDEGPIAVIAAMRCYVASKLGDDIKIPEELK